jgi:hypothetical protein
MACAGSMVLESGIADTSSSFADEGTAAHFLASECLEQDDNAASFIGQTILVSGNDVRWYLGDPATAAIDGTSAFTVDADMAEPVQVYIDAIRQYAEGNELLIEQRVDFSAHIGVPNSFGTSDTVVLCPDELQVHDLKFGRGVKVDAEENQQLMLYALGAYDAFGMVGDFKRVRMVIHQPRLGHVSEWDCTVEALLEFAGKAKRAAHLCKAAIANDQGGRENFGQYLAPGEKQCRFCKAKATCLALAAKVQADVGADFEALTSFDRAHAEASVKKHGDKTADELGAALAAVDLIETWCTAVRAEAERRLLAGAPVTGFKLVEGRRGARKWSNEAEAEALLKGMRLKHEQMYDYKLISPTTAEKLAKAEAIGPRQWPKVVALITQANGKPSVVPESDKRPALVVKPVADEFDAVATEPAAELV